jgi:hypothetical protein
MLVSKFHLTRTQYYLLEKANDSFRRANTNYLSDSESLHRALMDSWDYILSTLDHNINAALLEATHEVSERSYDSDTVSGGASD